MINDYFWVFSRSAPVTQIIRNTSVSEARKGLIKLHGAHSGYLCPASFRMLKNIPSVGASSYHQVLFENVMSPSSRQTRSRSTSHC